VELQQRVAQFAVLGDIGLGHGVPVYRNRPKWGRIVGIPTLGSFYAAPIAALLLGFVNTSAVANVANTVTAIAKRKKRFPSWQS
jgi:hypothetical protein